MHHIPAPQDQARILSKNFQELTGNVVSHQLALELVAKMMGHKDWKTMSAVFNAEMESKAVALEDAVYEIPGPDGGKLYEGTVTVDVTMSATLRVRAHDEEEAKQTMRELAKDRYPLGFTNDDGNYRGLADFYFGDEDEAVTDIGTPEIEGDANAASATWEKDFYRYTIDFMRDEPDSANDDRRAVTTVCLSVEQAWECDNPKKVSKVLKGKHQYYGRLTRYLPDCIIDGDFDDEFEKLVAKLQPKRRKPRK